MIALKAINYREKLLKNGAMASLALLISPLPSPNIEPLPPKALQLGDLIVRAGTGYESELLERLSHSPYSHIGVIMTLSPVVQVIHATTDDDPALPNQVIVSTFEAFAGHKHAKRWAIYRIATLNSFEMQHFILQLKKQRGKPFILGVRTEPHRYYSSLIAEQLPQNVQQQLRWSPINLIGLQGEIIYPNAFLDLPGIVPIAHSL